MSEQNRNTLAHRAVLRRCRLRTLAIGCILTAFPLLPAWANSGGTQRTDTYGNPAYIGIPTTLPATGANVFIDSGFDGFVYGGYTDAAGANADNNTVNISGGTVTGNIYGGQSDNGNATHNTVILSGAPDLSGSTIFGGQSNTPNFEAISGNRLELRTSGLTARNITNFAEYEFQLPATVKPGDTGLTLTDGMPTDMAPGGNATFNAAIRGIAVNGPAVKVGDRFTFISNAAGLTTTNLTLTTQQLTNVRQGVTLIADLDVKTDSTSIYAQVTDAHVNPQTKALAEGHLGGTALALQGADLVAGKGIDAAVQAVRTSLSENGRSVATFGALSGGWSRYNTGSHIDVSGFSLLTGLAWDADNVLGKLTTGMFFEFGNAATGTYNSFSNAASVSGDGSTWYVGAGLLTRMNFRDFGPGHIYAEASGRAGTLRNDYHNGDLRDSDGRRAEFDTSTPYVSLHAGLGYI